MKSSLPTIATSALSSYASMGSERISRNMNSQSRSFVKQVQVDLLALSDADLFHTVHQWVERLHLSELPPEPTENTLRTLGYTRIPALSSEVEHPPCLLEWQPPLPEQLRALLTTMDAPMFAQHVIPLAFQSLHPIHPEWYDGVTFNAHLANYLRQLRNKRVDAKPTPTITNRDPGALL